MRAFSLIHWFASKLFEIYSFTPALVILNYGGLSYGHISAASFLNDTHTTQSLFDHETMPSKTNTQKSARLQIRIVVNFTLNHLIGIFADTLDHRKKMKLTAHFGFRSFERRLIWFLFSEQLTIMCLWLELIIAVVFYESVWLSGSWGVIDKTWCVVVGWSPTIPCHNKANHIVQSTTSYHTILIVTMGGTIARLMSFWFPLLFPLWTAACRAPEWLWDQNKQRSHVFPQTARFIAHLFALVTSKRNWIEMKSLIYFQCFWRNKSKFRAGIQLSQESLTMLMLSVSVCSNVLLHILHSRQNKKSQQHWTMYITHSTKYMTWFTMNTSSAAHLHTFVKVLHKLHNSPHTERSFTVWAKRLVGHQVTRWQLV